jgi:predicted tellurium resistance membrane protein TerC
MDWVVDPGIWIGFLTLVALEIVLGIDNIVFISILAGKLPPEQRDRARKLGLALALISRLALLFALSWVVRLTDPLFDVLGHGISGRDLILIFGGLFLLGKSAYEISESMEGGHGQSGGRAVTSFTSVILQIMVLDIVFSLDSVITAVGMVDELGVMIAAVIVAVLVMLIASGPISRFVDTHPSIKMLALSFLVLIGVMLIAEGFDQHIPKGYIYFAMAFSLGVELLNIRVRHRSRPAAEGPSGEGAELAGVSSGVVRSSGVPSGDAESSGVSSGEAKPPGEEAEQA